MQIHIRSSEAFIVQMEYDSIEVFLLHQGTWRLPLPPVEAIVRDNFQSHILEPLYETTSTSEFNQFDSGINRFRMQNEEEVFQQDMNRKGKRVSSIQNEPKVDQEMTSGKYSIDNRIQNVNH